MTLDSEAHSDHKHPEGPPRRAFLPSRPELPLPALRAEHGRRAKKAAREAKAELDRLTLSSRAAAVLAKTLTAQDIEGVVGAMVSLAREGRVDAAREARAWLVLGLSLNEAEADADTPWHMMSPAQRAARRASLIRAAEMLEADARAAAAEHET